MKVLLLFSFFILVVFGYDFIPPCSREVKSVYWSPPFKCQNGYHIGNLTATRRLVHTICPSELVTVTCVQKKTKKKLPIRMPVQTLSVSLIALVLPMVVCFFNHIEPIEPDPRPKPRLLA
jgi:hypothetical protein